jgi:hypothetical protein
MHMTEAGKPESSPFGISWRTITVIARSRSRFACPKIRYPVRKRPPCDVFLALEFLAGTVEDDSSRRGLLVVPAEQRHALHATVLSAQGPATTIAPAAITVTLPGPDRS